MSGRGSPHAGQRSVPVDLSSITSSSSCGHSVLVVSDPLDAHRIPKHSSTYLVSEHQRPLVTSIIIPRHPLTNHKATGGVSPQSRYILGPSEKLSPPCPSDHILSAPPRSADDRYEESSPWQPEATSLSNSSTSLIGDDVSSSPPLKGGDINCNVIQHDKHLASSSSSHRSADVGHAAAPGIRAAEAARRQRMSSNGLQDSRAEVSGTSSSQQQQQQQQGSSSSSPTSVAWRPAPHSPPSRPSSHRLTPNSNSNRAAAHLSQHEQAQLMLQGPSSLFRPPHSSPAAVAAAAAADSRHFPGSQLNLLYPTSTGSSSPLYHQSLYMHQGQPSSSLTLSPYGPFHYGHASSTGYPSNAGALMHAGFPHDSYSTLLTRFNSLPRAPFHPGAVPPQYPLPGSGSPGPLPRLPTPSQPSSLPPSSGSAAGHHLGPQDRHPARSPKHELHPSNAHRGPPGSPAAGKFTHHPSLLKQPSYKPHHHPKDDARDLKGPKDLSCSDDRYKKSVDGPPSAKRPRLQQHSGGIGQPPPLTRAVQPPVGGHLPPPPPLQPSVGEVSPHYPPHFMKGSIIQLANGELKRVEELRTDDFVQSADVSGDLKIDSSTVVRIEENHDKGTAVLGFSVGEQRVQVTVEATLEHPFFVFGQGWSSCNPQQTLHRYGLQCHRLTVGDVCISLTHKDASTPSSSGAPSPKDPPKDKQGAATPKRKQPSPKPGAPSRPARASSTGAIHPNSEPGLLPRHCSPAGGHSALPPTASSSASSPSFPTSSTPPRRRWSAPDQLPACKRDVESKCRASPNNKMTTMSPPVSVNVVVSKSSSSSSRPVG